MKNNVSIHHNINPLKCSGIKWLRLKVFNTIQVKPTFLISNVRALCHSGLSASARMSEIKNVGSAEHQSARMSEIKPVG